jgi:CRISPR-associated protein Cas8a1/Csx13
MITATRPKISLRLHSSDTTIMHQVGMTGFYMDLKRLEEKYPSSHQRGGYMSWILSADTIELFWEGSDLVALSWLIKESFQLDEKGLIHLSGLDNDAADLSKKIHIHEGICAVFLRHNKFYKAEKPITTKLMVERKEVEYEYKPLTWYAHQTFAEQLCEKDTQQLRQDYVQITSWLYLGGIVRHAKAQNVTKLEEKPEYALALLFVPVVCDYYLLHLPSEDLKEKQPHRYLVVIPEIKDFEDASQRRWRLQQLETKQLHVSSTGEAGLLYYSLDTIYPQDSSYQACQVWLYEKMNQHSRQRALMSIKEIEIKKNALITYQQVQQYFQPNYQKIKPNTIFIQVNPIRSLIADNLAKGRPWQYNFWKKLIVEDLTRYLFKHLFDNREGIIAMIKNSEEDEEYLMFVEVFQQAMRGNFAKIYAKTEEGKDTPIQKKVERLRAELNCCYDKLSFQQYLSDFLVRGGLNKSFNEDKKTILLLIKKSPWEELRIWSLLAIASYKPKPKNTDTDNNSSNNEQELEEVNDESEL